MEDGAIVRRRWLKAKRGLREKGSYARERSWGKWTPSHTVSANMLRMRVTKVQNTYFLAVLMVELTLFFQLLPVAKVYNQKRKKFIYWQEMYKLLLNHGSTFGVVSPGFNDRRHSSWHGLIEGIEVLRGQSVSRPSFQTFTISDLNKLTT